MKSGRFGSHGSRFAKLTEPSDFGQGIEVDTKFPYAYQEGVSLVRAILWNTRYLEHAVAALRRAEDVPDQLLAHLSPLGWEHVNLTGDYVWSTEQPATENHDGLRPLRSMPEVVLEAA